MNTKSRRVIHNTSPTTLQTPPSARRKKLSNNTLPKETDSLADELCPPSHLLDVEGLLEIIRIVELSEDD
jgi:hypothetical protein